MKLTILMLICCLTLFNSCVSESEHEKLMAEKENILNEKNQLQVELNEIKFGAPNLLADGKIFFEGKDFVQARSKFQMLLDKHSGMPQTVEAKKYLAVIDEEELWYKASTFEDASHVDGYIKNYPSGKYVSKAMNRLNELKKLNMQKAYEAALSQNSSSAWKSFLDSYPDHDEAAAIRKKIIRLEVDEITGDRNTGKMPDFDNYNVGYSSSSTVSIKNDTGCELTVRYSGPDATMIVIPVGSSRSVSLSSGSYKITASACGENYAGSESLQGSYGSTFYISTTSY